MSFRVCQLTVAVCLVLFLLFSDIGVEVCQATEQPDRPLSFVTDGLGVNSPIYAVSETGGGARAGPDGAVNSTSFSAKSSASSLSVYCSYSVKREGLWFVTLDIEEASPNLPRCAQPSANVTERAGDFLTRYMDWTGNASLNQVIDMLKTADVTRNTTTTTSQWSLNVDSSSSFASFYWSYLSNGSSYRGLGITFAGEYVFFRDDRNLPPVANDPPSTIFNSLSPYGLGPQKTQTGVPVDQNFTFMTPRPAPILELYLSPEAAFSNVLRETRFYSGYYTFVLAEPLRPYTYYVATVLVGQAAPADFDSAPVSVVTWSFVTGDASSSTTSQPATTTSPTDGGPKETTISPTDQFAIPSLSSKVNFAAGGSYLGASLNGTFWHFSSLRIGSSEFTIENFDVSAQNCNLTIDSYSVEFDSDAFMSKSTLNYTVVGGGNQTFYYTAQQTGGFWYAFVDGIEGGYTTTLTGSDHSITVTGAESSNSNITIVNAVPPGPKPPPASTSPPQSTSTNLPATSSQNSQESSPTTPGLPGLDLPSPFPIILVIAFVILSVIVVSTIYLNRRKVHR